MKQEPADYDVLIIRLAPGRAGAYNVDIESAAGARGHGQFAAPSELDIGSFRRKMDPRNKQLRRRALYLEAATRFGAELFEGLVNNAGVREVYTVARHEASAAERGLRVTLSLGAAPELASIPWEFLYDNPRFLAMHGNSPVVRFVDFEDPSRPLRVEAPLRILGMISRPRDDVLATLDAEEEQAALERCLRPLIESGQVTLHWLARATLPSPDPIGDTDEPERYYRNPRSRNFVRLTHTAADIAKSLLTRMATDGCRTAAMINDGGPYGQDLANNVLIYRDSYARRMTFNLSQSVGPKGRYDYLLDRATKDKPDCFVYAGTSNTNTPEIFTRFRQALGPEAKLYGSSGIADARFYKAVKPFAQQVTVMLPWHATNKASEDFKNRFYSKHHRYPDPYAYNAYEAMLLALDAIKISETGKRADILTTLRGESPSDSVLGSYSFTANGDIAHATAGISTISDGRYADPQRAPPCRRC